MRRLVAIALILCTGCASANASVKKLSLEIPKAKTMINLGDVNEEEMALFVQQFESLAVAGEKDILVRIDSFGGSVFLGFDVARYVNDTKKANNITVHCVVNQKAMSMGLYLLADICDTRYMTKNALILGHNASSSARGNGKQIQETVNFLKALDFALSEVIGNVMNIGSEGYRKKVENGDWIFGWDVALEIGLIEAVVSEKDLPPIMQ